MYELLFLKPIFKEAVWGGNRLKDQFGYEIPSDHTGECWAISAHENGDCEVAEGEYKGQRLSVLWAEHPELFGNEDGCLGDRFPLLIKIIDAKDDLSIQVHPDDAYAAANENGSLGKTECWYILDCEPDTSIVIGHHAKDKEELKQMVEQGNYSQLIRQIPVHKGDFFQIDPGCVHAIKGGTVILETQQSSDVTYRVYDYDRKWNGAPRMLHVKESLDVIKTPFVPAKDQRKSYHTEAADQEHLETCPFYTVEKFEVHGCWQHKFSDRFANVSVLEGEGTVDGIPVKKGTHFIVPAGHNVCEFKGNMTLICSWIPAEAKETKEDQISIRVSDWKGHTKAFAQDPEESILAFKDVYEPGDIIQFHFPETEGYYMVRVDDTMDEALVYMTKKDLTFEVPFDEKKFSYNPKSFTGVRHYLTCRKAASWETGIYRNLAKNVLDQHGDRGCYPHASANVETRGESVFAARNAIDGVTATLSHGKWPYESWGINRRDDAELLLEFGRPVDIDQVCLWTRADFPHDNWWVSAVLTFSDGTREVVNMEKSEKAHTFAITKKGITWVRLSDLIKADDPSPFPALTQIEVYGKEA